MQFGDHIYWTDWKEKSVNKADKTTGKDAVIVRPHLDATMGLTMVTQSRQMGWNPCAINNGGCAYLCLFKQKNYTCACPDNRPNCKPGQVLVHLLNINYLKSSVCNEHLNFRS